MPWSRQYKVRILRIALSMQLKITTALLMLLSLFMSELRAQSKQGQSTIDNSSTKENKETEIELSTGQKGTKKIKKDSINPNGNIYAIIIGISKYKNLPNLKYADRDALAFANYLIYNSELTADSTNIKVLTNENATTENFDNAVSEILENKDITNKDRVIFYFSGHGDYEAKKKKDDALLLLYRAPKENYLQKIFSRGDYIITSELYDYFFKKLAEKGCQTMLIVDACHSAAGNAALSGGMEGAKVTQRALEGLPLPIKMFSCQSNQYSIESEQFGGGRGLFSFVLLEGLYGLADKDTNNKITVKELQRYLEDNVAEMAKPDAQDPVINTEYPSDVLVTVNNQQLQKYLDNKKKNIFFLLPIDQKRKREFFLKKLFSGRNRQYENCMNLIERRKTDSAYIIFRRFIQKDTVSSASREIRRMLSSALQEQAAELILPAADNIDRFNPNREKTATAYLQLSKALEILGTYHYLKTRLEARLLFLKALSLGFSPSLENTKLMINNLKASINLEPTAPYSYFLIGSIYQKNNQPDSALYYYQQYIDFIPHSSWALNNIGLTYEELGKADEAMTCYSKSIQIDSTSGRTYYNIGHLLMGQKKYDDAISYFEKAIFYWPESPLPPEELGDAFINKKNITDALKAYQKAYWNDRNNTVIIKKLGSLYISLGKEAHEVKNYSNAVHLLESGLKLVGTNVEIETTLGNSFMALADFENAYDHYGNAIKLASQNTAVREKFNRALYEYACQLALKNNYSLRKKSIELLLAFEKTHPTHLGAMMYIAQSYENINDINRAAQYYKKALKLSPNNPDILEKYIIFCMSVRKYSDALTALPKLKSNSRKKSAITFDMCRCYAALNKRKELWQGLSELFSSCSADQVLWWSQSAREFDRLRYTPDFRDYFKKKVNAEQLSKFPGLFSIRK